MKMICDPSLPNNQGTYRPLDILVPEGTLLNPTYPAACFWRLSAGMLVAELMFRIFARIAPERVPAESGSLPTWQFYVSGNRPTGEGYALHQHSYGGMGGDLVEMVYHPLVFPTTSVMSPLSGPNMRHPFYIIRAS